MKPSILVTLVVSLLAGLPAGAQSLFEQCQQKKADIQSMEAQARQLGNDIANFDNQIRELQRQRADKIREKRQLERRIKLDRAMMERTCRGLRECDKLQRRVENLKRQLEPLSRRLEAIRQELDRRRGEMNNLESRVQRISNSYRQLNCDNLVAGQTDQRTIDRCSALFSDWNRLQKDINLLDTAIKQMRKRYRQAMQKARSFRASIAGLLARIRKQCAHTSALAELERLQRQQQNWRDWDSQMQELMLKLRQARKLKVLRPHPRPGPKPRPRLRPAKKKPHLRKVP